MPAAIYNFKAEQGAPLFFTVAYASTTTVGDVVTETPIDITDYDASMQVRLTAANTNVILSLTSGVELTINGAAGTIDGVVAATVLSAIAPLKYVYDLELHHKTNGTVIRLIQGAFPVSAEVTR